MEPFEEYAVIDDYGDDWEEGPIAFSGDTFEQCAEWAESENYHSASIVGILENGRRVKIV
ncbi:hypothetical protein CPT_Mendera_163 [Stenotrophomonas phage Mendera]|uniref:Uncharacterized protein n=4 Tax=Menderavirus TaxID=2843421 RepID=A0A482IFI8_9CAUD|nr:hypothetical protein HWC11_gp132 [Stenotrophomonas phage YB07]YP_009850841.1 hypothetical protein HWC58_gp241 [Stenotrophomonas phage Moby]YP_009851197.1 hypothetical protein HWC60_gp252 [Stenotrophomonas phage Mendera]YP_010667710.1 hypothetical protein PQC01_gp247 [Stenotrophomonas maltophilia phage vB_SmaM_Ps15]QXN67240.1 hypothetical protein [Stenotrophomonas phage BUCT608]QYW02681.1 hypothetical protein CPT_Marzo_163 [Stenotrophomonas phage Marzo]QBP06328.1 hypothetical protein [Steno